MSYSITQFENNTTAQAAALDTNFTTFGALVAIPCSIAGTNTLTLTQNAAGLVPTPTIQGYSTDMIFVGVAAGTNTGPVTATVGSTGVLNVYKDTPAGPVLLTGGEIVLNNAISLRYDAALNTGAGGFHLTSNTAAASNPITPSSIQVNGNATLTNLISGNTPTLTFTATPGWSSQDVTFSISAGLLSALPAVGDFMLVTPPSLGAAGVDYRGLITAVGSLSVSLSSVSSTILSIATINIRLLNAASASLASNSGVYRYAAIRTIP